MNIFTFEMLVTKTKINNKPDEIIADKDILKNRGKNFVAILNVKIPNKTQGRISKSIENNMLITWWSITLRFLSIFMFRML